MGPLYTATADLHHACEAHAVGQRMAAGTISPQEWADWLEAFRLIHLVVDQPLPAHFRREALFRADLALLPAPRLGDAAFRFSLGLRTPEALDGAAYVLHGAHRRGGAMLAARMAKSGLPTAHVLYPFPSAVEDWIKAARGRAELAAPARATFAALLAVMDEIEGRR
jgi:heme oxygenase